MIYKAAKPKRVLFFGAYYSKKLTWTDEKVSLMFIQPCAPGNLN